MALQDSSSPSRSLQFELIGEAYVHGKIDGEAMADFEEGLILGGEREFQLL